MIIQKLSDGTYRRKNIKDDRLSPLISEARMFKIIMNKMKEAEMLIERGFRSENPSNINEAVIIAKKNIPNLYKLIQKMASLAPKL